MRILFDLGHPAHFHLFRRAAQVLQQEGHEARVWARQKDCLPALLDAAGWTYSIIPRPKDKPWALGLEALRVFAQVVRDANTKPFDLMVGTSVVVGPAARVTGAVSLVFNEDGGQVRMRFQGVAQCGVVWRWHMSMTPKWLHCITVTPGCWCGKDKAPRLSGLASGHSRPPTGIPFGLGSDIPACRSSVTHTKQRGGETSPFQSLILFSATFMILGVLFIALALLSDLINRQKKCKKMCCMN